MIVKSVRIDAGGLHYTPLNQRIRHAVAEGASEIILDDVMGQRFIADGLQGEVTITINGVAGGDLGMFMSGPSCIVYGNADHAPGNTMDAGKIVIHGSAGDAVAHSMRGGMVCVRDDIGYRGGIHMKEYQEKRPVLIVGGCARAFLGEYMAGGLIIVLRRDGTEMPLERGIGSGIHGGEIIIRGDIDTANLGVGARVGPLLPSDLARVSPLIRGFCHCFGFAHDTLLESPFVRITPASSRPFANKYTWE
jgi:glutamate synthase domain-containing protein 3